MIRILKLSLLVVFALAVFASATEKTRYDNYRIVRLHFKTQAQANLLEQWDNNGDFDLWYVDRVNLSYADVVLSPVAMAKYSVLFLVNEIKYETIHENIQIMFDEEERELAKSRATRANIINKFATYQEIQGYLDEIVAENPSVASKYLAGKSIENRDLNVLVLKTATSSKPVWIDCGIHAREWVSHPTCIYIIDQLLSTDRKLLDTYEFHILPLVNPDGYEYSRATSRLWRKNRRNPSSLCLFGSTGVDLNRNYDFQWMANGGASSSECSETYAGKSPDSEPETQAVRDAVLAKKGQWEAFFTIHSYGQWWLISYGHETVKPADYDDMFRVATAGVNAIKATTGTTFVAGQSSTLLYINSGCSQDWAKGSAGIKYSYTLELQPGQGTADANAGYGFRLPEDRLPNVTKETFAGIKAALAAI